MTKYGHNLCYLTLAPFPVHAPVLGFVDLSACLTSFNCHFPSPPLLYFFLTPLSLLLSFPSFSFHFFFPSFTNHHFSLSLLLPFPPSLSPFSGVSLFLPPSFHSSLPLSFLSLPPSLPSPHISHTVKDRPEISSPVDFEHTVHVGFDPNTGEFTVSITPHHKTAR